MAKRKPAAEVEITSQTVRNMMNDPRFLQQLPFLRRIKQASQKRKKGCGCGRKTKPSSSQPDLEQAKRKLANMGPGQKAALKKLMQADQIRIPYRKSIGGRAVKIIR